MKEVIEAYTQRYRDALKPIAANLETLIKDHFDGTPHVDRISARAKSPERFAEKAAKTDEHGRLIYRNPLSEIQDQLGARVVVFYKQDIEVAAEIVRKYFNKIEAKELVPESQWEFGYFGQHYIVAIPRDVVPEGTKDTDVPRFFELQVKTLFQHAWSEGNHDLGYKPSRPITDDQKRRFAYTAAQAWGADRVFGELYDELS
jgi:putative GTP pyrophosphokinase